MLVHNEYGLSASTMALVSTVHPYYQSIIFDVSGTYLSKQTIDSLFKEKGLVQNKLTDDMLDETVIFTYVISLSEDIYAYELPRDDKNRIIWLFPKYDTEQTFPRLTFTNGERLIIQCSLDQHKWMKKNLNRLSQLEV